MKPHTLFEGIALGNIAATVMTDDEGLALICAITAAVCATIAAILAWSQR